MAEVSDNNADYFFSYDTCVGISNYSNGCIYIDKCPVYGQESGISRTTARHIKKWLDGRKATYIDHDTFQGIVSILS